MWRLYFKTGAGVPDPKVVALTNLFPTEADDRRGAGVLEGIMEEVPPDELQPWGHAFHFRPGGGLIQRRLLFRNETLEAGDSGLDSHAHIDGFPGQRFGDGFEEEAGAVDDFSDFIHRGKD